MRKGAEGTGQVPADDFIRGDTLPGQSFEIADLLGFQPRGIAGYN
jgi:hypothetical protein